MIAILMQMPLRFAYSCEGRWWALECWLFSVRTVLDWLSLVALAGFALYAVYRVCERIGDLIEEHDHVAVSHDGQN